MTYDEHELELLPELTDEELEAEMAVELPTRAALQDTYVGIAGVGALGVGQANQTGNVGILLVF
jgi:hypothetical protein